MDVVTVFLNGEVEEGIFVEVTDQVQGVDRNKTIRKLWKVLYAVKQVRRRWNIKIVDFLKSICFKASPIDYCF